MAQNIYWQNLDPEIAQAIKDAMKSGVNFKQETLPATTVGQKVWTLPWSELVVGQDLVFVVNNTATLHDDMYTITKQGANAIVTIKDGYIPVDLPIADNTLFVTMAKGVKYENGVITTILAKDVVFEPVDGLTKTNVQEAIEEVFVYAKGIIKTVADSLGSPFEATMTRQQLDDQFTDMMARFKANLENKKVKTQTTDTIYDYIYRILEIDTGEMKKTEWKDIVAPFDWVVELQEKRDSSDLLMTVIERIAATATEEIYSCMFNTTDKDKFFPNALIEFTDNAHLTRGANYDLMLDTDYTDGYKHWLSTSLAGIPSIDTMKIVEKTPSEYTKWIHPVMMGVDLPSPYRSKCSGSTKGAQPSWHAFSEDMGLGWISASGEVGRTHEWVKLDYGSEITVDTACLWMSHGYYNSIEVYSSNDPSVFNDSDSFNGWAKFASTAKQDAQASNSMVFLDNITGVQSTGRYFMFVINRMTDDTGFLILSTCTLGGKYL